VVVLPEWRPPPASGGGRCPMNGCEWGTAGQGERENKRKREEVRGLPERIEGRRRRRLREVGGDGSGRGRWVATGDVRLCERVATRGRGRVDDRTRLERFSSLENRELERCLCNCV